MAEPGKAFIPPVIVVWPSAASESVSPAAMSERSALTAADSMVVPGTNAASARLKLPLPLRGMVAPVHWLFFLVVLYRGHVWKLLQGGLIGSIIWSNAAWHWTPNNYLAVLLGVFAARVLSGVHCRIWHIRHGLMPPQTVPFGNNLRSGHLRLR